MKKTRSSKFLFTILGIGLLVFVFFNYKKTSQKTIERPTKEFYINDSIGVLLNSTKWYIFIDGDLYYNDILVDDYVVPEMKGTQIVVGTYDKANLIDSTKIFNNYGIGKNNLGIMLLMGYNKIDGQYVFDDILFEIGTKMSTFISAFEMDNFIGEHFYDYGTSTDYDSKIFNLYYKLIELTADRLYDIDDDYVYDAYFNTYDYSVEKYTLTKGLDSDKFHLTTLQLVLGIIGLILFLGSTAIIYIFPYLFDLITGSGGAKGGGGKSGGYYSRK